MELKPVAYFHSPIADKFGLPRQSGVVPELRGHITLEKEFRSPDAIRGLEGFDYLWLLWGFSLNRSSSPSKLTVRPPRLGGNERLGVFATRSPFRPNPVGLSSVRIESVDYESCTIYVSGADLADGTPIYDIKPYLPYCDSHPGARGGFTDKGDWKEVEVAIPEELNEKLSALLSEDSLKALRGVLSEDPRPKYHDDPQRVYGMLYSGLDIKFRVSNGVLTLVDIIS